VCTDGAIAWVVSRVGPGVGVLGECGCAASGRGSFGV